MSKQGQDSQIHLEDFYVRVGEEEFLQVALSTEQAAKVMGISPRKLEYWRSEGRGPVYAKPDEGGPSKVYYLVADLIEFLATYRRKMPKQLSESLREVVEDGR